MENSSVNYMELPINRFGKWINTWELCYQEHEIPINTLIHPVKGAYP